MKLKIFTTGGTIDKIYFDAKNDYQVGEPEIESLLSEANVTFDYTVESLLRKDSLEMTEADRKLVHDAVAAEPCSRILITHGTDTMLATGKSLLDIADKTIVLTGSMQPARLRVSDAFFNVGFAVAAVQLLSSGVYVVMNGQVFDPRTSRKNVEKNCFERL
ncbi:MAG: asparaginase [Proteobacteria bacterium]|nr:asparaginase [Pseudomonadota bacterium]MBU1140155.1 asparaginase [Pseudomonadota bacterium]MBU1231852.1 asparaginase [Pseudomonadota bacterium]MBU1419925.1 asparaginase [Pseudomonadota bacterium]MBU1456892.1 asparaginase [Pseudomonadota bacterium]